MALLNGAVACNHRTTASGPVVKRIIGNIYIYMRGDGWISITFLKKCTQTSVIHVYMVDFIVVHISLRQGHLSVRYSGWSWGGLSLYRHISRLSS